MNIKLTKRQLEYLKIFLERVTLSGKEVPAYLDLIKAINDSIDKKDNK